MMIDPPQPPAPPPMRQIKEGAPPVWWTTARLVGLAQILITLLFLGAYLAVFILFLTGNVKTQPEWKDAVIALLGVITGSIGTVVAFWFNRSRTQELQP